MAKKLKSGTLNPKTVALSLASVSAVISLICAALLAVSPKESMKFFGSIFHGIDITKIAVSVTIEDVATGLVAIIIVALVTGWLFAVLYNYFAKR